MAKLAALLCLFLVAYASATPSTEVEPELDLDLDVDFDLEIPEIPDEAGLLDNLSEKVDELKEQVAELIRKAVRGIEKKIQKSVQKSIKFMNELKEKANVLTRKLFNEIDETVKRVDQKIDELTGRAPGVNVTECTQMAAQMHDTAKQLIGDAKRCVSEKLEEGSSVMQEIVMHAHKFVQELYGTHARAVTCTKGTKLNKHGYMKILTCLAKAFKEAGVIAYSRIPVFMKKVGEMTIFLKKTTPLIAKCTVSKSINTFLTSTDGILSRIEACIELKKANSNNYIPAGY